MSMLERSNWLQSEIARMAADRIIHDSLAVDLLLEALGGTEWLLSINDGEVA